MDKVISATLKVLAVLAGVFILYVLRDIIAYFIFAFVIASALRPGVDYLEKKKIPRVVSGTFIFLLFLIFVALIIFLIIPPLSAELQNFFESAPQLSESIVNFSQNVERSMGGINLVESIKESFNTLIQSFSQSLTAAAGILSKFFGSLFNFVFIIIIAFYFTIEKKTAERVSGLIFSGNKELEKKVLQGWKRAENIAGRWLYSYLILGTIVGILVYIALSILGVKYALILALIAALLEVVPVIGPVLSGIIGVILALLQGGTSLALWVALVFIIVQQLENFLIVPLVMKKRIDLHPILVIVVLFVAGKLFGVLVAIISIPLTAILIALIKENYSDYFIERRVKPLFGKSSK